MLMIDDFSFQIGDKKILKNIDLAIEAREMIGLIGPNGSGKSTLLKSIARLHHEKTNSISLFGQATTAINQKTFSKLVSYVPQDTSIDFDFSTEEIVRMGRHVHQKRILTKEQRLAEEEMVERAMHATKTLSLAKRSILNLSGGQRQLVLIAKMLAQDTEVLLLDEPISALDIYYQLHILQLLRDLADSGKLVIVVLHDLNLAARFCTKLALLEEGELQVYGPPTEVLKKERIKKTYKVDSSIHWDEEIESVTVTALLENRKKE